MPYTEERKAYARQWYAKNKARLNADPAFREAKKATNKKFYQNHSDKLKERTKKYQQENKEKVSRQKKQYWLDTREERLVQQKKRRQTEEYKKYMREYRKANKEKIKKQEKVTNARFIRRQIENLTDTYIVQQIALSPLNNFSIAELRKRPDLIEKKRAQIMAHRQRFGTRQMETDIMAEIEAAQKKRNEKPYQFISRAEAMENKVYSK